MHLIFIHQKYTQNANYAVVNKYNVHCVTSCMELKFGTIDYFVKYRLCHLLFKVTVDLHTVDVLNLACMIFCRN